MSHEERGASLFYPDGFGGGLLFGVGGWRVWGGFGRRVGGGWG